MPLRTQCCHYMWVVPSLSVFSNVYLSSNVHVDISFSVLIVKHLACITIFWFWAYLKKRVVRSIRYQLCSLLLFFVCFFSALLSFFFILFQEYMHCLPFSEIRSIYTGHNFCFVDCNTSEIRHPVAMEYNKKVNGCSMYRDCFASLTDKDVRHIFRQKNLKIPKVYSESELWRRRGNIMTKRKRTNNQQPNLHRKLQLEQHSPHYNRGEHNYINVRLPVSNKAIVISIFISNYIFKQINSRNISCLTWDKQVNMLCNSPFGCKYVPLIWKLLTPST